MIASPMRPRHLLSVIVIMALFGSAYPVGKLGVDHFSPFEFATMRSAILALVLLPLWRLALPPRESAWPLIGFCACMGVGVYATMYVALALADSVSPIIIGTQLCVPFAVLLGRYLLDERVRLATWVAIVAAFGGVVLIAFEPALLTDLPALGMIAVSALFYALATQFARSLRELPVFTLNGWMALSAVLPLAMLSMAFESGQWEAIRSADAVAWAALLHSAILVSLIAHVWMFSLYRHYPVASVIPYYVLMPVFGIAFVLLLFAEAPSLQTMIGGGIVIAATWVVNHTTRHPVPADGTGEPPPPDDPVSPEADGRGHAAASRD